MRPVPLVEVRPPDAVHDVRADEEPAEHEGVYDVACVLLALALQALLLDGVSHEGGEQQQRLDQPDEAADDHPAGYEFALWTVVHVDGAEQDHEHRDDVDDYGDWWLDGMRCDLRSDV